jgi:hypothetical protein
MKHLRLGVVVTWALTLLLLSAPVQAQQTSAANAEIEEQAMAVLKRMAEFLSQAPRFSVTVDTGFDVVQGSGQKIEFGEMRQIMLRRPTVFASTRRNAMAPRAGCFSTVRTLPCLIRRKTSMPRCPGLAP